MVTDKSDAYFLIADLKRIKKEIEYAIAKKKKISNERDNYISDLLTRARKSESISIDEIVSLDSQVSDLLLTYSTLTF